MSPKKGGPIARKGARRWRKRVKPIPKEEPNIEEDNTDDNL